MDRSVERQRARPARERLERAAPLLIPLLVLVVFGRCLWAELVWDDKNLIVTNPWLAQAETLLATWRQDFWSLTTGGGRSGMYRPVVIDMYWLEYRLWGTQPASYHGMNLLLHSANAMLVFGLARRLGVPGWAGLLGATCFAVHPVQVEAAASVASHTDLLATLFTLGACLLWTGPRSQRPWASLPLFLALCSKESAVVAPLLLVLLDRRLGRAWLRPELLWAALPWGPWLWLRSQAVGGPGMAEAGLWEGGTRILAYAGRLVLPLPQGPITQLAPPPLAWAVASSLILGLGLVYLLSTRPDRRLALTGAWVLVALAPVAEIFPLGARFADLLLYLPMCGVSLGIAEGAAAVAPRLAPGTSPRRLAGLGIAGLLLTWAGVAFTWAGVWQSDLTLWTHGVAHAPESVTANLNLGNAYRAAGRVEEGCAQLGQTLTLLEPSRDPGTAGRVHYNLGNCAREAADWTEAEAHYRRSMKLTEGGFLPARYNLIATYGAMGRPDLGQQESARLVAQTPQLPQPWHLHGVMLAQLGRFAEAVEAFDRALALDPSRQDSRGYRQRAAELAEELAKEAGRSKEPPPDSSGVD